MPQRWYGAWWPSFGSHCFGLSQRQVADILGLHSGAAVSARLRKLTERLESQRRLRKKVAAITAELRYASR